MGMANYVSILSARKMYQSRGIYLVFPRPERAAILGPFAFDDRKHSSHRFFWGQLTFYLPIDINIGHVARRARQWHTLTSSKLGVHLRRNLTWVDCQDRRLAAFAT